MSRSITKDKTSLTRPGSVTYDLPTPESLDKVTTITIPPHSDWTSGSHWHEMHTEYLGVVQGTALVTHNGVTRTFTSADGLITIYPYARHEWRRASPDGEDLIVREFTDPSDGQKEIFFRNLNSVIGDSKMFIGARGWLLSLQLFMIFNQMDNFPVLLSFEWLPLIGGSIETLFTHIVLMGSVVLGGLMGFKGVYEEYTPSRLMGLHWRQYSDDEKKVL